MAARSRIRPAHWIVLVLVAAPAWKVAERLWRPGPRVVDGVELLERLLHPADANSVPEGARLLRSSPAPPDAH